jgi:hypothetical protein
MKILPSDLSEVRERTQARFEQICDTLGEALSVQKAQDLLSEQMTRLARLRAAQVELQKRSKILFDRTLAYQRKIEDRFIEGEEADARSLREIVLAEAEQKSVTGAIARLVEHAIPITTVSSLRAREVWLLEKARELMRISEERMEKAIAMLGEAAEFEGGITVDVRNTLSGLLVSHAEELEREAAAAAAEADELERRYQDQTAKIAALGWGRV